MTHMERDYEARIARALDVPSSSVSDVARLLANGKMDVTNAVAIRQQLALGLGARWNDCLDHKRSRYLAKRIRSLLGPAPVVLDVLSGTGTVADALRGLNVEVVEIERTGMYGASLAREKRVPLDEGIVAGMARSWDAAIVVASLHHERDVYAWIDWLGRLPATEIIVIENARSSLVDEDMHRRFDWFFNHCLNDFAADCPGHYWTVDEWKDALEQAGTCSWVSSHDDVPGVPFPYDVFRLLPRNRVLPRTGHKGYPR